MAFLLFLTFCNANIDSEVIKYDVRNIEPTHDFAELMDYPREWSLTTAHIEFVSKRQKFLK